jgi:D-inositol-3-phosphate glycosyltransferase
MNLTCVAPAYPYRGGIAAFGARLAAELAQEHSLQYINFIRLYPDMLFPGKTQYDTSNTPIEVECDRQLDSMNPISWYKIGRRISKSNSDAVIFHWWHPFFGPAYREICRSSGEKITKIAVCHNVLPHDKSSLWTRAVRYGLGGMNGNIVHSKSEISQLKQLSPKSPALDLYHPIYDIFPGQDTSRAEARRVLKLKQDARIILNFGLIRPYKGVDVLLNALKNLDEVDRLFCLIVGEIYSDRELIEKMVSEISPNRVRLIDGYIPNEQVALWFRAADIVVLPYRSATQSGVVPIAYRCNRPVIVTNVGGLPDAVLDGQSGYLIEPENPSQLADTIRRFFIEKDNPDLSHGINQMRDRLSWSRYAKQTVDFIRDIRERKNE